MAGVGCWGLALWRTRAYVAGRRSWVCGLVVAEELLGLLVLYLVVRDGNLWACAAYALGGGLGAWLAMSYDDGTP